MEKDKKYCYECKLLNDWIEDECKEQLRNSEMTYDELYEELKSEYNEALSDLKIQLRNVDFDKINSNVDNIEFLDVSISNNIFYITFKILDDTISENDIIQIIHKYFDYKVFISGWFEFLTKIYDHTLSDSCYYSLYDEDSEQINED